MCSFLGLSYIPDDLDYINELNAKRGPDGTNVFNFKGHCFAHNLLSITGEYTEQPFVQNDVVALFNGEIYNFDSFGIDCKSDGEIILPLYQQHGPSFVSKLDGEFAIVICDFPKKEILFITDAFATKPLWYTFEAGRLGFASYESVLKRSLFTEPVKVPANSTLIFDIESGLPKDTIENFSFDLNQYKTTYDDWLVAFSESIRKRTNNLREKVYIGLSSGYDSAAIACELTKQSVPFKSYSIKGKEDEGIILQRHQLLKEGSQEVEMIYLTKEQYANSRRDLKQKAEEFQYRIRRNDKITQNEMMTDDKGAVGLYYISERAREEGYKIYLSGQGADEIFSDYGFRGQKIYQHSTFGGLYPKNLEFVFPWNSFYESTQYSYLGKEENVPGALGIEGRYPFLDIRVVQEFLWLHPNLKNSNYKSVLREYLVKNSFPFKENEKVGFSCDYGLR